MRLLLLLALAVAVQASELRGVVVHLRAHGKKEVLLLDRDDELGIPRAHAFFAAHFPGTHERLNAWTVLALMREPVMRAKIQEIMDVASLEKIHVMLILTDKPDRLYRGETVTIPAFGGKYSLRFGAVETRDLYRLAKSVGSSGREIAIHDPDRYYVFPHALRNDGLRGTTFYVGEAGIGIATAGDVQIAREMILHEIAHIADTSEYDAHNAGREHGAWTVLPPARALAEGWAEYWGAQAPGSIARLAREQPPRALQDAGAEVLLRTTPVISAILADLARLPPGRDALHAAVRAAWTRKNPTLADVLGQYTRTRGFTTQVAEILARRTSGQGTPYDFLMRARGHQL